MGWSPWVPILPALITRDGEVGNPVLGPPLMAFTITQGPRPLLQTKIFLHKGKARPAGSWSWIWHRQGMHLLQHYAPYLIAPSGKCCRLSLVIVLIVVQISRCRRNGIACKKKRQTALSPFYYSLITLEESS
jgi:hypothetical protein